MVLEAGVVKSKGKRVLSREARAAMSEAGRDVGSSNLAGWREKRAARMRALEDEVTAFRAALLRDAGANPSASKTGLIETAVLSFTCILKLRHSVINGRKSDVAVLTERASWQVSNMARVLKTLGLDARARPRSFADLVDEKPPEAASNGPV